MVKYIVSATSDHDTPDKTPTGRQDQSEQSRLQELRMRRGSPAAGRDAFTTLVSRLQEQFVAELDQELDLSDPAFARAAIQEKLEIILTNEKLVLNRNEKRQVVEAILRELNSGSKSTEL